MSGSSICLERLVGIRILPGHLLSAGDLTMTLRLTSCRQATIVFRRPQHCISAFKIKWEILEQLT